MRELSRSQAGRRGPLPRDIRGQRFGSLVVTEREETDRNNNARWRCRCDCGSETVVYLNALRQGRVKSCGCAPRGMKPRHGHTVGRKRSPTYESWRSMHTRCLNPSHIAFAYYGGRGITICEEWLHDFGAFLADMGERPEGTTLDRIDPDGNYEPDNCRWATPKVQIMNRRVAA